MEQLATKVETEGLDALREEIATLRTENAALREECDSLENQVEELSDNREDEPDICAAIDAFLDEVDRPVGQLNFTVPKGPAIDRAILALFDAVGRNP